MADNFTSRRIESRRQNNARTDQKKSPILGILVGVFLVFFSLYVYVSGTGNISIPAGDFTVASGETVASLNHSQKLGITDWRYKLYVKFLAPEVTIKAGDYRTTEAMTLENFLKNGLKQTIVKDNEISITLLPGWNIWDFDAYFAEKGILNAGDFIKAAKDNLAQYQSDYKFLANATSLEGFLMPDTYRIYRNSSADAIIRKLLNGFQSKISEDYLALSKEKAYQTLILASIVEREERNAKNRPIVAGILAKRVREGIAMGADATVCYGFQKTFSECTPSFIASVINDHSNIYNTRKTLGYPPTPISAISVSAWNAALNPENSAYYYYLHDNDGVIHYAKTNAEHNANVQKYLR